MEAAEDVPCSRLSSPQQQQQRGAEKPQVDVPGAAAACSAWLWRGEFVSLSLCLFIYEMEVNKNSFFVDQIENQIR